MAETLTLTVNQYLLLGVMLVLFGAMGLKRGANRELLSMLGIGLGTLFSRRAAVMVQPQVNRLYQMVRATQGVPADAAALVTTPAQLQTLALVLFVAVGVVFYLLGQRLFPKPASVVIRMLGLLAGGINGYLAASFVFPNLVSSARTVAAGSGGAVGSMLTTPRNVAFVVLFFLVVLIVFGLYNARSTRPK